MSLRSTLRHLFVRGDRPLGPRVTVGLTMAVALLSVITGIANISTQSVVGPLATVIPIQIQRTAGFTGVLTGFLMIGSALGLRRGLRVAWYSTVALLPLTALQGLLQSSPLSAPLVILSVLAMPNALYNRGRFTRSLSLSTSQLAAVAAIVGVQIYGTVGAYALREDVSLAVLIQAALLLVVVRGLGTLAARIGVTRVACELGTGFVLEPPILGRIAPEYYSTVFPGPESPSLLSWRCSRYWSWSR